MIRYITEHAAGAHRSRSRTRSSSCSPTTSASISQREVGTDTPSFSEALRNAMRQDPDVIMVGEMRDPETIATVITAAETGHLVFSTLHTNSAPQTIDRILDTFPPEQQAQVRAQLAQVLKGVVSMKLVERQDGQGLVAALEIMRVLAQGREADREGRDQRDPRGDRDLGRPTTGCSR